MVLIELGRPAEGANESRGSWWTGRLGPMMVSMEKSVSRFRCWRLLLLSSLWLLALDEVIVDMAGNHQVGTEQMVGLMCMERSSSWL